MFCLGEKNAPSGYLQPGPSWEYPVHFSLSLFLRLSEYKTGGMVRMADRFAVFFTPLDESLYFSEFTVVYIFKAPSKS